jgi:hypothetical protein
MKRRIYQSIVLLAVAGTSFIASGQESELSLYNKIAAAIGKTEPTFRLDRKAILPNQLVIRWTSEAGRALVSVNWFASEQEARGALKSRITEWEHIPEAKISKRELDDSGDEGYIFKTDGDNRATIFFKKGIYVAQVVGPSDDTAKTFARKVSDLLPASNKSLHASRGSVFRMKLL